MLGSNQRPLPCESGAGVFRRSLHFTKGLQKRDICRLRLFLSFQVIHPGCCTVAAPLLHDRCWSHPTRSRILWYLFATPSQDLYLASASE